MEIIFVRHGETFWNVQKRLQGQTNKSYLTENGIKQAEEIAKKLQNIDFDVIISSPLDRTIKTAKIIRDKKNIKILKDKALQERGYGNLEGEFQENKKYNLEKLWDYEENYAEENVEPIQSFFTRIYRFLDILLQENKYKKVLIVSHSGVAIAINTYFNGIPTKKSLLDLGIKNCEVVKFNAN